MTQEKPYNPLAKGNLGTSVADALLDRPVTPLPPPEEFDGAGIYAIYYAGDYPAYAPLAAGNSGGQFTAPIYVGKAIPPGARRGGFGLDKPPGAALYKRLCEHAESIQHATNLRVEHFSCRYLVTDDIWIPLGENLLIEMFSPLWNMLIDGFGNHDPGKGRYNQQMSPWDVLHPGRPWARKLAPNARTQAEILKAVKTFLSTETAGRPHAG